MRYYSLILPYLSLSALAHYQVVDYNDNVSSDWFQTDLPDRGFSWEGGFHLETPFSGPEHTTLWTSPSEWKKRTRSGPDVQYVYHDVSDYRRQREMRRIFLNYGHLDYGRRHYRSIDPDDVSELTLGIFAPLEVTPHILSDTRWSYWTPRHEFYQWSSSYAWADGYVEYYDQTIEGLVESEAPPVSIDLLREEGLLRLTPASALSRSEWEKRHDGDLIFEQTMTTVPWDSYDSFLEPIHPYWHMWDDRDELYSDDEAKWRQQKYCPIKDSDDLESKPNNYCPQIGGPTSQSLREAATESSSGTNRGAVRNRLVFHISPWRTRMEDYTGRDSRIPLDLHQRVHAKEMYNLKSDPHEPNPPQMLELQVKIREFPEEWSDPEVKRGGWRPGGWLGQDGYHLEEKDYWEYLSFTRGSWNPDSTTPFWYSDWDNEATVVPEEVQAVFDELKPVQRGVGRLKPAGRARAKWNPQGYWRPWTKEGQDPEEVVDESKRAEDSGDDAKQRNWEFRVALDRWVDDHAASPYFEPLVKIIMLLDELEDVNLRLASRLDDIVFGMYGSSDSTTQFFSAKTDVKSMEQQAIDELKALRIQQLDSVNTLICDAIQDYDGYYADLNATNENWNQQNKESLDIHLQSLSDMESKHHQAQIHLQRQGREVLNSMRSAIEVDITQLDEIQSSTIKAMKALQLSTQTAIEQMTAQLAETRDWTQDVIGTFTLVHGSSGTPIWTIEDGLDPILEPIWPELENTVAADINLIVQGARQPAETILDVMEQTQRENAMNRVQREWRMQSDKIVSAKALNEKLYQDELRYATIDHQIMVRKVLLAASK